jgi:hypothetical protein
MWPWGLKKTIKYASMTCSLEGFDSDIKTFL